jgi:hypothetical protein
MACAAKTLRLFQIFSLRKNKQFHFLHKAFRCGMGYEPLVVVSWLWFSVPALA